MNKAEIAEELGLTKAARRLDNTTHLEVDDVFVDRDGKDGIEFSLESRETFVLLEISRVCDKYNLKVEELDGGIPESVVAVSQKSVDVKAI
jgi:hypothetical protein